MKQTYEGQSGRQYRIVGERNCHWDEQADDFRLTTRTGRGYVYLVGTSAEGRECGFEMEIISDGNWIARELRSAKDVRPVEL